MFLQHCSLLPQQVLLLLHQSLFLQQMGLHTAHLALLLNYLLLLLLLSCSRGGFSSALPAASKDMISKQDISKEDTSCFPGPVSSGLGTVGRRQEGQIKVCPA